MRLPNYRFTDYRLAAYVVVAAVIAGGVAFALDHAFAPSVKVQANGAPVAPPNAEGVRQIPIAKTSAADLGDPNGKLSPVYPVSPGKDLAVKDAPVIQAQPVPAKPVATTNGSASATAPVAAAPLAPTAPAAAQPAPVAAVAVPAATTAAPAPTTQVAATPSAANACNVAACAAAYRSFRESDCSYQPFGGPRRYCEGAPDPNAPAGQNGQIASQPQTQPQAAPAPLRPQFDTRLSAPAPRSGYDDALRDAERQVRRLPPPGRRYEDDDDDRDVVMEAPQQRYDLRRNWVVEPQE